ncbi:phosphatidylserine decarboxylase [Diplogelasinospora grovesii]|uniref:Phosphatidylserine decarboxylase n=1 Tax=Diplogelasinospora grovesii TaxID=303347 RepID=A0AAN6MXE0_9PEZI|nr:phosphatidylserine decarboxylase [Diplogelasinospora grovesii]
MNNKNLEKGRDEGTPASKAQIKGFVEMYGINMDDFEPSDISEYKTFEDFFTRKHKPGTRPIHAKDDASKAVRVAESKRLWIKGSDFSIAALVMDTKLGKQFADGAVASFRLSPQDYHRYHSPVTGKLKLFRSMPGDYYDVDPVALRSRTEEFGDVLFVAIGSTQVGSVQFHEKYQKEGTEVTKGDEIGFFQFGGSSIIVAFEPGRVKFDPDLLKWSKQEVQVSVEVGMSLGSSAK